MHLVHLFAYTEMSELGRHKVTQINYRVGHKKPSPYMSANYVFQEKCTFKVNTAR